MRKNKPGGYFSNWFSEWRSIVGLTAVDYHSYRHTVRSQLAKKEIPEAIIDTLLGHEIKGSTGAKVYTHRSLQDLNKAIQNLKYPAMNLPRTYTR